MGRNQVPRLITSATSIQLPERMGARRTTATMTIKLRISQPMATPSTGPNQSGCHGESFKMAGDATINGTSCRTESPIVKRPRGVRQSPTSANTNPRQSPRRPAGESDLTFVTGSCKAADARGSRISTHPGARFAHAQASSPSCRRVNHGRPLESSLRTSTDDRISPQISHRIGDGSLATLHANSANQALDQRYVVQIAASGALIPEACAAAEYLWSEGVAANVLNLTSPRTLFESWRTTITSGASPNLFDWLILPGERNAPIVTVQDGASHALAWLGSVFGTRVYPLGVDDFGQSGSRDDLYRHFNLDAEAIAEAAFSALDETTPT